MQEIGVVVQIRVKPGRAEEQVALFRELAPLVRAEGGCIAYDLHPVVDDPTAFVIVERWASRAALDAHEVSPHMVAADARTPEFRAGPAVVTILGAAV